MESSESLGRLRKFTEKGNPLVAEAGTYKTVDIFRNHTFVIGLQQRSATAFILFFRTTFNNIQTFTMKKTNGNSGRGDQRKKGKCGFSHSVHERDTFIWRLPRTSFHRIIVLFRHPWDNYERYHNLKAKADHLHLSEAQAKAEATGESKRKISSLGPGEGCNRQQARTTKGFFTFSSNK